MHTKVLRSFAGATLVIAVISQKIAEASIKFFSSADLLKAEVKLCFV